MTFVLQPFEVTVRVRLNLEIRRNPPSFVDNYLYAIRVMVSSPACNTLFIVRFMFIVTLGYDVIIDTCTGVYTKLQSFVRQISHTVKFVVQAFEV